MGDWALKSVIYLLFSNGNDFHPHAHGGGGGGGGGGRGGGLTPNGGSIPSLKQVL